MRALRIHEAAAPVALSFITSFYTSFSDTSSELCQNFHSHRQAAFGGVPKASTTSPGAAIEGKPRDRQPH